MLERYKGVDELAEAWRKAGAARAGASLHVIGKGSRREVIGAIREQVNWTEQTDAAGVAEALDRAWVLVLPSRSEGMGRVILEAFCRNRAVIGSDVGGIADLVRDGENGLLVPPRDPDALAEAMVRVLSDRALAERLGAGTREEVEPLLASPEEYARRLREIVDAVVARCRFIGRVAAGGIVKLVFVTQQVDPGIRARRDGRRRSRRSPSASTRSSCSPTAALPGVLPANCRVRTFAARPRAGRGAALRGRARRRARAHRPAAVVAHMCPIYAVLAAPLARPLGVRVLLWFTHWRASRMLALAERVSTRVLTRRPSHLPARLDEGSPRSATASTFPNSPALSDDALPTACGSRSGATRAAKGLETVLRAVRLALATAGSTLRLEVHGPALTPEERAHRGELERLVAELELDKRVELGRRSAAQRGARPLRPRGRARQQHARRRDRQGRLRGVRELRPGDRLESAPSTSLLPGELRFDRDDPRLARRAARDLARRRRTSAAASAPSCASESPRRTRSALGRRGRGGGARVTTVLHVQKV